MIAKMIANIVSSKVKMAYCAYVVLLVVVAALTSPWVYNMPIVMWTFCAITMCVATPMFIMFA